jgi:LPS sulfotransferase NodH
MLKSSLPSHLNNPFGVVWEVLKSGNPAAYSALWQSALGVATIPFDVLLRSVESDRYSASRRPSLPQVFVCGPPRSGTTLAAQVLLETGQFGYFNNLMSLFPRAPVTAAAKLGRLIPQHKGNFKAFYGKTRYLSGPNDSLYLWDRWTGGVRDRFPRALAGDKSAREMRRFFAAWETFSGKPLLNKNNRLNGYAELVAPHLPNALFICMRRESVHLAQSLYIARERITRKLSVPYGAVPQSYLDNRDPVDPVRDVCRQVQSYEGLAQRQQQAVGAERFWLVSYEQFCADPGKLIERVTDYLGEAGDGSCASEVQPFPPSRAARLPTHLYERLESECAAMGLAMSHPYFA